MVGEGGLGLTLIETVYMLLADVVREVDAVYLLTMVQTRVCD